ncbi:hypothetical protein F444_12020 [Phytophthora nicotianae P1976]|uniref:Uncharacterized protein n=1 Tax=Phytophthora nicotianae P1976 TaxID=1317066 RepID=A0A080ZYF0_PHYNI|nr:hypothetical protein F444_12020 [Phytophthora nicotianae P1976]
MSTLPDRQVFNTRTGAFLEHHYFKIPLYEAASTCKGSPTRQRTQTKTILRPDPDQARQINRLGLGLLRQQRDELPLCSTSVAKVFKPSHIALFSSYRNTKILPILPGTQGEEVQHLITAHRGTALLVGSLDQVGRGNQRSCGFR